MARTDAIGLWADMGIVDASPLSWLKFPNQAVWGNSVFRITLLSDDVSLQGTHLWIRQEFPDSNFTQAHKYYPSDVPQLLELPIPKDVFDRNVTVRSISVRRSYKRFERSSIVDYPLCRVQLEELAGY